MRTPAWMLVASLLLAVGVGCGDDNNETNNVDPNNTTNVDPNNTNVDPSNDPNVDPNIDPSNDPNVDPSNDPNNMAPGDIIEVASETPDLSTLVSLIETADLVDALKADGPFTVFAPVNAAFDAIPTADLNALAEDPEALANVLQFHVVSGELLAADVIARENAVTLNGQMFDIRVEGDAVILTDGLGNDVNVTTTDIEASNGVVHLIDGVLFPPADPLGNIVEVATDAGNFTTLLGAATTAGLATTLATGGPFTVFAPTDAAFTALGGAVPTNADLLANVLLHHIVAGTQDSAAVVGATSFTTLANTSIAIDASGAPITVGGAALSATLDVQASNGIIHAMDEVIVPPTILETAGATADLSTLVTAVGASSQGVQDALAAEGPITVFAPNNGAFAAIPQDDLNALLADQEALDDVLSYHVAAGQTLAGDLSDGQMITMANGDMLEVSISGADVQLIDGMGNAANVVTTDIRLLNGVVHLIDAVVMPPAAPLQNIVDTAAAAGNFTTLLGAATATGLDTALATGGPFTVFAPTDAAFTALGVDLTPVSGDVVANILLHHVVSGTFLSNNVVAATSYDTLANTSLSVDASGSPVLIGGAALSATLDVLASNGVIHAMDEVIVPPTILEAAAATADLSTLVTAVGASSTAVQGALDPATLTGDDPVTVFAPIDSAFAALSANELNALLADQAALDDVLSYHVATGQTLSGDLTDGQVITMANGDTLEVSINGSDVQLIDATGGVATVVTADIRLLNGVVHLIDTVVLPEPVLDNIVDTAAAAGTFTSLLGAATATGLDVPLANAGPFTVFAPSDAAFTALGVDLTPVSADVIANILLHHVVDGQFLSGDVVSTPFYATLANTALSIDASGTPILVGGSALSSTLDVLASNGVIHVMDEVIVPPTVLEAATDLTQLSTLVTAVGASSAGVQAALDPATLTGDDPITVFAPTNSAFAAIPAADLNALLADQGALDDVLSYHVAAGQTLSGDLTDGQVITMANGDTLEVSINGSDIQLIDAIGQVATVTTADVRLLNGVVHLIDTVVMPQGNIVEIAAANGNFTTLLGAATATGLDVPLSNDGPFTVFAPTDAAFTALGVDLTPVSADVIANILLHHVVAGEFFSGDVVAASSYATLANTGLSVDASGTPILIGGANLSSTLDVDASNGVIHAMDQVIVPPTILEVAVATPDLSSLVTAVGAANPGVQNALAPNTLAGDAPITVFAPTNAAFTAAGVDPSAVTQQVISPVLRHHAVSGQALSSDLTDGQILTTLNGDITINIDTQGNISVTDGQGNTANVIATLADIRTLTGVVHVIDAVLLP